MVIDEWNPGAYWDGTTTRTFAVELLSTLCGDGTREGSEACDDGNLIPGDGCSARCQIEAPEMPSQPGQLVISELMILPQGGNQSAEWFEITNLSAVPLDLLGCESEDDNPFIDYTFDASLVVLPGETATVGHTPGQTGFNADYYNNGFIFVEPNATTVDGFSIKCDGVYIDTILWDDTWPVIEGHSIQLNPDTFDAVSNDAPANWCVTNSSSAGFTGGFGNPGVLNPPCPILAAEDCSNAVDDDLDAQIDCRDSDCFGEAVCQEICDNGIDDNDTGDIDCADATCALDPACDEICGNGIDDDFDGDTDCYDAACAGDPACQPMVLTGCDPTWCTLDLASGPNGGDLCTCQIPGSDHPTLGTVEPSCFGGTPGRTLTVIVDLASGGYGAYSADTCVGTLSDTSLAAFDGGSPDGRQPAGLFRGCQRGAELLRPDPRRRSGPDPSVREPRTGPRASSTWSTASGTTARCGTASPPGPSTSRWSARSRSAATTT